MPPGRHVVLYDGHCRFCTVGAERFVRWMGPVAVERLDFQQPGALDRFPGLSHADCMKAMRLVTPDGRVYAGAEAIARALATRPYFGALTAVYYAPGLCFFFDSIYDLIAHYRYRILGRTVAADGCDGGTCALHFPPASRGGSRSST